ncbi:hypothetical protein AMTRI_Chr10g4970 [Amborella trichopoda]
MRKKNIIKNYIHCARSPCPTFTRCWTRTRTCESKIWTHTWTRGRVYLSGPRSGRIHCHPMTMSFFLLFFCHFLCHHISILLATFTILHNIYESHIYIHFLLLYVITGNS